MTTNRRDSAYWYARADETRAVAESMVMPEHREAMLKVAQSYELIARQEERMEKGPLLRRQRLADAERRRQERLQQCQQHKDDPDSPRTRD